MSARLIIDGNAVYEIDEECMRKQRKKNGWYGASEKQERQEPVGKKEDQSFFEA